MSGSTIFERRLPAHPPDRPRLSLTLRQQDKQGGIVQRSMIAFSLVFAFAIGFGHSEARAGDALAVRATSDRQPIVAAPVPEDDSFVRRSARGPFVDLTGTASRGLYLKA